MPSEEHSAHRQPYLQSYQSGPLAVVARRKSTGATEIDVDTGGQRQEFEVVSAAPRSVSPAVWVAVGDPRAKRLVSPRIVLKSQPSAQGNLRFSSQEVASALTPTLSEMSENLPHGASELELDLVVYQSSDGAKTPQQVSGTAKMTLRRVTDGDISLRPLPAITR
jgi:hypothetical protein